MRDIYLSGFFWNMLTVCERCGQARGNTDKLENCIWNGLLLGVITVQSYNICT